MGLQKDLKEFLRLLISHKARFVVVGAHAVAFHGFPRLTGDIDIFVEASLDNSRILERVFTEFGFQGPPFVANEFQKPNQCFQIGRQPNRIDILTGVSGLSFHEVWAKKIEGFLDGIHIYFLSYDHLIVNKNSSGRPKDLLDVAELNRRKIIR